MIARNSRELDRWLRPRYVVVLLSQIQDPGFGTRDAPNWQCGVCDCLCNALGARLHDRILHLVSPPFLQQSLAFLLAVSDDLRTLRAAR
eukprot:1399243-Lingulodinium_polyedra.AAC.2